MEKEIVLSDFSRLAIKAQIVEFDQIRCSVAIPDYNVRIDFLKNERGEWTAKNIKGCHNPKWLMEISYYLSKRS
ncbi:hypothetical protein [Desertivirga arenae]|uniref:hypothetical protein n=1 Tax=Desertivirga arenae TaxID=2810309 RepID=UPI001A971FA0|nr:hypothetical protein [Pedobacter sp. SYSU D00823]